MTVVGLLKVRDESNRESIRLVTSLEYHDLVDYSAQYNLTLLKCNMMTVPYLYSELEDHIKKSKRPKNIQIIRDGKYITMIPLSEEREKILETIIESEDIYTNITVLFEPTIKEKIKQYYGKLRAAFSQGSY